jgi:RNA polymerase sigma-70 factor (ECF subfamily)
MSVVPLSDLLQQTHAGPESFATTHWSVVLSAADEHSPGARQALEQLCRAYWRPLYTYVRRRGLTPDDAQDLTQEFFWRLLDRNYLSQVDPRKGKFRSFLLVAVNHFLANEWDKARAVKRGGRVTFVPLDAAAAEEHLQALSYSQSTSPERLYEQSWSLALLERALSRLRQEARDAGRERQFSELKILLTGERSSASYAELAVRLDTTEAAVKMAVQRLRRRFAELVREELAQTVSSPDEVEEELRHLFAVLAG